MRIFVVMLGLLVASCTGMNRAMTYTPETHHVKMGEVAYRVFEHPEEDVIMTTPPIGAAMTAGFAKGLTLGLANTTPPEKVHEAAARKYLDENGRAHCRIVSGYLVMEPQYEFKYDCSIAPKGYEPRQKQGKVTLSFLFPCFVFVGHIKFIRSKRFAQRDA